MVVTVAAVQTERVKRTYSVVLVPNEFGGFDVVVPALPGCFSQGTTREEALEHAREAIEVHITGLEADGDEIPQEDAAARPTVALVTV
jgi:antitoxin HicB